MTARVPMIAVNMEEEDGADCVKILEMDGDEGKE